MHWKTKKLLGQYKNLVIKWELRLPLSKAEKLHIPDKAAALLMDTVQAPAVHPPAPGRNSTSVISPRINRAEV